jgi:hypothetical protein
MGDSEAELPDAGRYAVYRGIIVAWVSGVKHVPVDRSCLGP